MQWGVHGTTASRFRSGREAGKNENRFVVTAEHGRARFAPRPRESTIAADLGAADAEEERISVVAVLRGRAFGTFAAT